MAEKKLVVVESPAKAKTINKYLGKEYIVEASVGHIKDLIAFRLGVDIKNNFAPQYVTIKGKGDVIKRLTSISKTAPEVLIATDPDREGEAIAWHIANEIRKNNSNIKRVLFNEITKAGVKRGLEDLRNLDENLFMSQQARRVMDRLIGYQVSPFLSKALLTKTTKSLSAGRVQSVALRLICEREEEILTFIPIDFWTISGLFESEKKEQFKAKLIAFDGNNITNPDGSAKAKTPEEQEKLDKKLEAMNFIRTEEHAKELIERILQEKFNIFDIAKKKITRKPFAPFTTSSLQQEAARRLGFSNKRTMNVAQRLYEGVKIGDEGEVGLITYMRTDSVRLSPEAQKAAQEHIMQVFGSDYLPPTPPVYVSKSKNVQDAHEAIRPTSLNYSPKEVRKYLEKDQADLYELIYNRFLASQMNPAIYDQTTIEVGGGQFVFRLTASVLIFRGFLAAYADFADDNNYQDNGNGKSLDADLLSRLKIGQPLAIAEIDSTKSQTKPPSRYNSASLVKELDELGIGRPSTYATIVSTLLDREYVEIDKKSFIPSELGNDVNKVLVKNFPDLFNVKFTADMEFDLDSVAEGNKTYVQILSDFYKPFSVALEHAHAHGEFEEIICDKCGAPMEIKVSRGGRFLGCTNYPTCKNTKPLPKGDEEKVVPVIADGITCDICGSPMYIRESKFGKFYGCVRYPECKGTKPIKTGVTCPKCKEGTLLERFSPKSRKKFWGCSNYPKCDYLTNHEPVQQECPKCGNYFIEIRYRKAEETWEKYLRCPECKSTFELEAQKK